MDEPHRIFLPVSDTALKEEFFEENFPADKPSDELCNRCSLFEKDEISAKESQCLRLVSQAVTETEDTVEALPLPLTLSDINILKKEFADDSNTHITVKQEVEPKYAPSDIKFAISEELIHDSSESGLLGEPVVIKDELIVMDIDQELPVNKSPVSDVSNFINEEFNVGERCLKTEAVGSKESDSVPLQGLARQNTSVDSAEKYFESEVCNKAFTYNKNLSKHKLIDNCDKKYQCDICSKAFTTSSNLSKHKLVHSNIRRYHCDTCNKAFIQKSHLSTHTLLHSGIRKYQCDVCNKAFTTAGDLYQHKLIHGGIKKYQCDVCSSPFITSSSLSRHKLIHSGIRRHQCDICKKAFIQSAHLLKHKFIHSRN